MRQAERRIFKRFKVRPVLCSTNPELRGGCVLKNVSLNGAFFLYPTPPPIGAQVHFDFAEPPLEGYLLHGKVVRHNFGRRRGFAVDFQSPRPKLLRAVYCNDLV